MINYLSLNHNKKLLAIGKNDGFSVILIEKNKVLINRPTKKIFLIELFYNTNLIFIIGDNKPLNILNIWDDSKEKYIGFIEIKNNIEFVKMNKNFILISDNTYLYIYNFENLQFKKKIYYNSYHLFHYDISFNNIITYTDKIGFINLYNVDNNHTRTFKAHDNNIQYIKISNNSKYIASVSENGSIIKVFDFNTFKLLKLLYRGINYSKIISIDFDMNDEYIFVFTNNKTLHIYNLNNNINPSFILNSITSFFKNNILDYETSLYKINLNDDNVLCVMNSYNQVYIINKKNLQIDKYILNNDLYSLSTITSV